MLIFRKIYRRFFRMYLWRSLLTGLVIVRLSSQAGGLVNFLLNH